MKDRKMLHLNFTDSTRRSAKQFEQTPTPGNVYKPKQAADVEDEDIFANVEDVVAFYDKNPPKRVRIGSDW